jgi:cytochrome b subunit of formate dehydrogenase
MKREVNDVENTTQNEYNDASSPSTSSTTTKIGNFSKKRTFIVIGVVVVILCIAGFFIYRSYKNGSLPSSSILTSLFNKNKGKNVVVH